MTITPGCFFPGIDQRAFAAAPQQRLAAVGANVFDTDGCVFGAVAAGIARGIRRPASQR